MTNTTAASTAQKEQITGHVRVAASTARGTNGIEYRYCRFGSASRRPLILLQHFRGNLDNWGDNDRMILPDAAVNIHPDAGHGFLFKHHVEFAADTASLLDQ